MKNFTIRDIIFLAVLAALTLVVSAPVMLAVASIDIFALRNAASAIIYALAATIAITRVPKIGAMTIFGLFTGGPLLLISSVMFFNQFLAGLLADIIVRIVYKDYATRSAIFLGAFIFIPATLPMTAITSFLIKGVDLEGLMGNNFLGLVSIAMTFVLSYLGTKIGMRVTDELKEAGRL